MRHKGHPGITLIVERAGIGALSVLDFELKGHLGGVARKCNLAPKLANSCLDRASALALASLAKPTLNSHYFLDNHRTAFINPPCALQCFLTRPRAMSYFERALEADRIEMPECRCGKEMQLQRIEPAPDRRKAWALCCCFSLPT